MSKPLKLAFTTKIGDKEVRLAVRQPSAAVRQHGRLVHAKAYNHAVQADVMLRQQLETHLRRNKMWDDERQAEYDRLRNTILAHERTLAKGGIKLGEGRRIALEMSKARLELQELLAERNSVDANTADSIADQAQFNFFVAACTVYDDTGTLVFTNDGEHPSTDLYIEQGTEQHATDSARKLSELMFGNEKDILEKLPENQFLKRFKFIDSDLHLINAEGRKVDEKGRLVDDEGRFIDASGNYVDADGNRVDKEGRYVIEEMPFLDDDGKPITEGRGEPMTAEVPIPPDVETDVPAPKQAEKPEKLQPVMASTTTAKESR